MKKALALILSLALMLSVVVLPGATLASAETVTLAETEAELTFSDAITILEEDINPRAIRTKVLSDGTVAAVYYRSGNGIYYATSDNGGVTFSEGVKLIGNATDSVLAATEIAEGETASTQVALAKEYVATYGEYGRGRLEAQNPNLIELKNGDIAAFYRYNTFETDPTNKPWSIYYASICYQILDKETGVWGDVQVMYECTEESVVADSGSSYGVWEPDPVYIGDELFCYFADTDLPGNVSYQHIMYCVYDEETGKFGEPAIAQNGIEHNSRDGMSVVTKLSDGTYAMVFESTNTSQSNTEDYITFVIKMSFSSDGKNWSDPVIVAKPEPLETSSTASIEYGVCAAPYVVTLPDGRLAVSYQTTDRYTGRIPNRVSYRIGTQVAISSQAITSETFANNEINDDVTSYFATEVNPGVLGENEFSKSASLMVKDDKLYVYYSVGNNIWITTDGVETEKHNFGDVKMAYMDVSVEEATDYTSLDNYIVYQANETGAAPNAENGVINIAASGTTNLIAGTGTTETVIDSTTAITDLYNSDNYTLHGKSGYTVTINENSLVTSNHQTKSMLNNTVDLQQFESWVNIKGSSTGTFYGGMAFHIQEADFEKGTFNTSGCSVFVRRNSSWGLGTAKVYFRYASGGSAVGTDVIAITTTELSADDKNLELCLYVAVDETSVTIKLYDATRTTLYGEYTSDFATTSKNAGATYYDTGAIAYITNGVHTFSNIEINSITTKEVDTRVFEKATNLKAHGVFTMLETPVTMYAGFSFHVKDAAAVTAGLSGYTVKLLQTSDDVLKLEFSVYELNEGKTACSNLKSYSIPITEAVLGTDVSTSKAKLILDVTVIGDTVTATVTNYNDNSLTHTQVYDLNDYYTYAEYGEGGYGIYKHGNGTITAEDVSFTVLPLNVNNITDSSIYTVYRPELSEEVTFEDNAVVNNDATTKKIMLNDTLVSDFKADTTLEIGYDGNLKGGIIFRAQNVGGENDEMEGYSAVVFKNHNNSGNYGRMVLLVYKWARLADGSMSYMGTVGSKVFADTLNSVYPDAKNNMLASAGVKVRLNLEVEGDTVVTSFDVFDKNNAVAASSDEITVDLNNSLTGVDKKKVFAEDAATTVYNAGEVGLSISTLGKICDFNLEYDELGLNDTDVTDYTVYSSNTNTMVIDDVNDKIYSTTTGHKQAVLSGRNAKDFDVTATLKSTSAGVSYNLGYDFGIKESTHSKTCAAGSSTTYMFEGYRVQLTRTNATGGDLSYANLRLYKFERVDNGDGTYSNKRTELANVPNADFFADYDEAGYGNVEVVLNVKLEDGVLSANAYVKDYPTRTLSYTYTDEAIVNAEGTIGWYIDGGGSITMNNIKLGFNGQMITAADCTNGSVYATINSGAATVGDDVKIVPVAKDGYRIDTAYANATEVKETENGYVFQKAYGDTEISATFFLVGDIDSNDKVDGVDITCMRKELLGLDEYNAKYTDINDDDATNLKDLVRIKKIAAGIE